MLKKLSKYLPSLHQCWVIVFFLIAIGGLGVGTLLQVVCGAVGADVAGLNPLVAYVLPIVPALLHIVLSPADAAEAVKIEAPCRKAVGKINVFVLYPLLAVAMIALGFVSEPLSNWLPMPEYIQQIFEKMLSDSFWAFATVVVAAPLLEEFILRGVIMRGLLYHTTPLKSILWSAFFFAIIHLNPWQAIGAFVAGAFLGWVYWRTHSLWACIFIHAVNNGTAYLIQLLFPHIPAASTYKDLVDMHMDGYYWIVFVIFAVLLAAILHYLNKNLGEANWKTHLKN